MQLPVTVEVCICLSNARLRAALNLLLEGSRSAHRGVNHVRPHWGATILLEGALRVPFTPWSGCARAIPERPVRVKRTHGAVLGSIEVRTSRGGFQRRPHLRLPTACHMVCYVLKGSRFPCCRHVQELPLQYESEAVVRAQNCESNTGRAKIARAFFLLRQRWPQHRSHAPITQTTNPHGLLSVRGQKKRHRGRSF